MSVARCAIPFEQKFLPSDEMSGCVDYMGAQDAGRAPLGSTGLFSSVSRISVDKVFYVNDLTNNGGGRFWDLRRRELH